VSVNATTTSVCYNCTNVVGTLISKMKQSGVPASGGRPGDPYQVNEYYVFPLAVAADPNTADSEFDAPAADGNWTANYVTTDPFGNSMPLGGIEWTSDGSGLNMGDPFDLTLSQVGPTPDTWYEEILGDSVTSDYTVIDAECPEPSALALLSIGSMALLRRPKARCRGG
jgi:hypothetical protein